MKSEGDSVSSDCDLKKKMAEGRPCYKRPFVLLGWLVAIVVVAVVVYFAVEYFQKGDDSNGGEVNVKAIPPNFLIGVSTSSYQIEGAWNIDGKGLSNWDYFVHNESWHISNGDTGDVACDSYHLYKEDVRIINYTGFNLYRISISWPRVLPTGDSQNINPLGIQYYHNLIDEILSYNITPMVTIYHWDLPLVLEQQGGWTNPIIVDYFVNYTDVIFKEYGDKVKYWCTINEMKMIAVKSYGGDTYAPARNDSGVSDYQAAHNLLRAHGKAYRNYEKKYKATQKGLLGVAYNVESSRPYDPNSVGDIAAVERYLQFEVGIYAHPIYSKEGDYPKVVRDRVDNNSAEEGRNSSRLPTFTQEEIEEIRGSADFFGLNHYFTKLVKDGFTGNVPSVQRDSGAVGSNATRDPTGLRELLNWLTKEYNSPLLFVTENGRSGSSDLEDPEKTKFFQGMVGAVLEAYYLDKINIGGYVAWSIMDNFEWQKGYTAKYGLWAVDFNSTSRNRNIRQSGRFFKKFLNSGILPDLPFE